MEYWYSISNKHKWQVLEVNKFVNRDLGVGVKVSTEWKWGTFDLCTEKPLDLDAIRERYGDEDVDLYSEFEDCHVNWLDSGHESLSFWDVDFEGEIEYIGAGELNDLFDEDGLAALDEQEFFEEDAEMFIIDGITIEESENPFPEM